MTPALQESRDIDLFQLARLLGEGDWPDATQDLGRIAEMVRGASRIVWAGDGSRLIAFGSSLTDGAVFGFITHVVVRGDRRRHGIGRAVVERLVSGHKVVRFAMRAPPSAAEFCKRLGFAAGADSFYYASPRST
jgi:hypothetical protein